MLPVVNEIGLDPKNSKLDPVESSSLPILQKINLSDGAHCSTGIKVKDVAEINKNYSILGSNAEENENRDYLKRDSSCADKNDSKRVRLSVDIDGSIETYEAEKITSIFENKNADTSCDQECVNGQVDNGLVFEIKSEPLVESNEERNSIDDMCQSGSGSSTSTIDIKRAVKIEKADACSSSRESCRFGIRCYRRNPVHRIEEAHPGDNDYKRPNYPSPPKGTPDCPYGSLCYRRNPSHFEHFSHPPETNFEQNYKTYRLRERQRQHEQDEDALNSSTNSCELDDDYDLDDPFSNDEEFDSDYLPNSIDEDDDDEYDSCDKVEE